MQMRSIEMSKHYQRSEFALSRIDSYSQRGKRGLCTMGGGVRLKGKKEVKNFEEDWENFEMKMST